MKKNLYVCKYVFFKNKIKSIIIKLIVYYVKRGNIILLLLKFYNLLLKLVIYINCFCSYNFVFVGINNDKNKNNFLK